ncbi:hypothetical protein DEU56DRAFT_951204 [Suillus clintonianus]|uniref:uncharacterized protein n=1 Tax=Suillus clintonianus TaxID=1904413 RepID=UPI001B869874|nr:uncharacterized protein DEU56DRAFT_951204 [Suillus clintonianus]KAG2153811.1 hypothetical protein DEU56DRAFT_951204 [Suillus clintonianus]
MPQKKWTKDQEEFLASYLMQYRACTVSRKYANFSAEIGMKFFERWPERKALFGDLPDDEVLTPEQTVALAQAVAERKKRLITWYRWQTNPSRLGRTSGIRGVLRFDTVLAGGVEMRGTRAPQKIDLYSHKFYEKKIKHVADKAIHEQNITERGPKLNKRRDIIRQMYVEGSEEVKAKIERKYSKTKARYAKTRANLKKGKAPKVDDSTKTKAIRELGPMLDRILQYLRHITGGWKFTVLMGGHDPSTGEVSVFNYHVGELESGAQFNQAYSNFDLMQSAFLSFVKDATAFESALSHEADSAIDSDSDDEDDGETSSGSEDGDDGGVHESSRGLYRMPASDSSLTDAMLDSTAASPICVNSPGDNAELSGYGQQTRDAVLALQGYILNDSDALPTMGDALPAMCDASGHASLDLQADFPPIADTSPVSNLPQVFGYSHPVPSDELLDADPSAFDPYAFLDRAPLEVILALNSLEFPLSGDDSQNSTHTPVDASTGARKYM